VQRNFFKRVDIPTLALVVVSVGLLVAYRIATHAGFGFVDHGPNGAILTGFLANPSDNFSYVAWGMQAANGRWLFADPYTLTPHRELYFNPYFLLVGIAARMARIPVPAVLILSGIGASAVTIYAVFMVARASGVGTRGARWAAAFAAFGSGLSGLATVVRSGGDVVRGSDLRYAESVFSSTFYVYPYHSVAYALLALCVAGAVSPGTPRPGFVLSRRRALALAFLTAALAGTHPYEAVILVVSLWGSVAVAAVCGRRQEMRRRLRVAGICALGGLPILLYVSWLSSQPVWKYFAGQALANAQPRLAWVLGYGAPGMLAVIGLGVAVRRRDTVNLDWALTWLVLLAVLLIVLAVPQTKVACGGYLPIAVAAGATMEHWTAAARRSARLLRGALVGAIVVVSVSSFVFLLGIVLRPHYVDGELLEIVRRVRETGTAPARVLAPTDAAGVLPALGDIRVYAGHWGLTDAYPEKVDQLRAAGFESEDNAAEAETNQAERSRDVFDRLVRTVGPQFVVSYRTRPATDFARRSPRLRPLECLERWCVFQAL
jgi:hypothetical protein